MRNIPKIVRFVLPDGTLVTMHSGADGYKLCGRYGAGSQPGQVRCFLYQGQSEDEVKEFIRSSSGRILDDEGATWEFDEKSGSIQQFSSANAKGEKRECENIFSAIESLNHSGHIGKEFEVCPECLNGRKYFGVTEPAAVKRFCHGCGRDHWQLFLLKKPLEIVGF